MQEQLTAVEAATKSQGIKLNLQLESKQKELTKHLAECQLHMEMTRRQLQEAKENERLVDVIGKEESKFTSLQDEMKRLAQNCSEKSQLISCTSQDEMNLRRENARVRQLYFNLLIVVCT